MHECREDLKLGKILAGVVIPTQAEQLAAVNEAVGRLREVVKRRAVEVRRDFERHGGIAFGKDEGNPVPGVGVDFLRTRLEHCAAGEREKTENKPEARKGGRSRAARSRGDQEGSARNRRRCWDHVGGASLTRRHSGVDPNFR